MFERTVGRKSRRAHDEPFKIPVSAPDLSRLAYDLVRRACRLQSTEPPRNHGHRFYLETARSNRATPKRLKSGADTRQVNRTPWARRDFRPTIRPRPAYRSLLTAHCYLFTSLAR